MDDLISRQNLMTTLNIKEDCHDCVYRLSIFCTRESDFVNACEAITDAPSIDAVEVVRCKDCFYHGDFDENGYCVCECTGAGMPMQGFCSDGERKKWL